MPLLLSSVLAIVGILLGTLVFVKAISSDEAQLRLKGTAHLLLVSVEVVGDTFSRLVLGRARRIAAAQRKKVTAAPKTAAPKIRQRSFLLDLLLPMAVAKDAQANLNEVMPVWLEQHGQRKASFIRAVQIGRIVIGHWSRPLVKIARRLVGL